MFSGLRGGGTGPRVRGAHAAVMKKPCCFLLWVFSVTSALDRLNQTGLMSACKSARHVAGCTPRRQESLLRFGLTQSCQMLPVRTANQGRCSGSFGSSALQGPPCILPSLSVSRGCLEAGPPTAENSFLSTVSRKQGDQRGHMLVGETLFPGTFGKNRSAWLGPGGRPGHNKAALSPYLQGLRFTPCASYPGSLHQACVRSLGAQTQLGAERPQRTQPERCLICPPLASRPASPSLLFSLRD